MSKDVIYSIREHFRAGGDYPDRLKLLFDQEFLNNAKTSI